MAKKEKKSGLGKGINSLFPKVEEKEVEEGLNLEDILKSKAKLKEQLKTEEENKEDKEDKKVNKKNKKKNNKKTAKKAEKKVEEEPAEEDKEVIFDDEESEEEEIIVETPGEDELTSEEEPVDADKELTITKEDFNDEGILVEESNVEKYEEEIVEEEVDAEEIEDAKTSSKYTNVFHNDDIKLNVDEEKIESEACVKNIESTINLNENNKESTKIIEAFDDINERPSFLTEKEEKLIDEVIETVEKNPRITLWSARSAAVLRYLRKTEPEFSISNEASKLIDEATAVKYPEIWTLFNHL